MAVGANSYSDAAIVAGYTPRYASSAGVFDTNTNPTLARVEGMIDRVSGLVNAFLTNRGYGLPLTDATLSLAMENVVTELVVVMVEGVRGTGRYAPNSKAIAQRGMFAVLNDEIMQYLDAIITTTPNTFSVTAVIRQDGYSDDLTTVQT